MKCKISEITPLYKYIKINHKNRDLKKSLSDRRENISQKSEWECVHHRKIKCKFILLC